ncbi:inositol monophosphatase [Actinomadura craniellae]|uniref:Inositol monophosphatase n=1 Tax=Actinomadura craniellae TaxID=2231787 RepID=A0A365HBC4_9ACTN|nr:inositol monophosphatase [Actinomadura craniellae]RAY16454.1 inositol monophosphatase [Actinomadura craniellae]
MEPPSDPVDLARALGVAIDAAEAAGILLRTGARGPVEAWAKGTSGDVVTALDLAAEDLILRRLRGAYPEHRIISEEAGVVGSADGRLTWLVDPLDGTNNVAVGLPVYAVGLALCAGSVPVLGVVHDPLTARTWSATCGGGARGPDGALSGPSGPGRDRPVIAWTQGHAVGRDDPAARALKMVLEARSGRLLQLWAPLVAWVMLARGDIDGVVGYRTEMVDLPAGALIAREAGAVFRGADGGPYEVRLDEPEPTFVAARPALVDRLLETVADAARLAPRLAGLGPP